MKKIVIVISLLLVLLTGCGKKAKYDTASDFLPPEEVSKFLWYEPVLEEKTTRLEKKVTYKNEIAGSGDIVKLSVYPPNTKYTARNIHEQFNSEKKRNEEYQTLISAEDLDTEAFIAIPSIHLYKNGHYAVITAGSGGGDEQIKLLKELANIVIYNLDKQEPVDEKTE